MTRAIDRNALTEREREVLALAKAGLSNNEMATSLGISRDAVRYHLKELHSKLETGGSRASLVRRGLRALVPAAVVKSGFLQPAGATLAVASISFAGFLGVRYANGIADDDSGARHCVAEVRPRAPGATTYPEPRNERCFETREELAAHLRSIGVTNYEEWAPDFLGD